MQSKPLLSLLLAAALLCSAVPTQAVLAAGPLCYVDDTAAGLNNGTSWANAYINLQTALADSGCGEIWVAAGTYRPGGSGSRASSFQLKNNLAIYGGFSGSETTREMRNWTANPTFLSGDLDADGNNNNNDSYHVVFNNGVNATAVLDGFTITGGYANGGAASNNGAGVYNWASSPTYANLIITSNVGTGDGGGMANLNGSSPSLTDITLDHNSAAYGGGMINYPNSSPTLTRVIFISNSASTHGGGMRNYNNSHPTLNDVTFQNNTAVGEGGGMVNDFSSPTLTRVTFSGNSAAMGGGMHNNAGSSPILNSVDFTSNQAARQGGGMRNSDHSNPILTNVTFSSNSATDGGAVYNGSSSSPILTNARLMGNKALGSGGGMYNSSSSPILTNVIIMNNSASYFGGGIENISSSPTLVNVTLANNDAERFGGGMDNYISSSPTLTNSIVWGNTAQISAQIYNSVNSQPAVSFSDIQGAYASGSWDGALGMDAGGNLDADPLFGTESAYPHSESPIVDRGSLSDLPLDLYDLDGDGDTSEALPVDLEGIQRVYGAGVDLGAIEHRIWHVAQDAAGAGDCTSWADACPDLKTALSLPPREIWVAAGTYRPGSSGEVSATYELHSGQALYGGFTGAETARDQRDWQTQAVILSGDLDASGSFSANDANRVVTIPNADNSTTLDGFTITGGYSTNLSGSGIYNLSGCPNLIHLTIHGNRNSFGGGGMYNYDGSPTLRRVTFSSNTAAGAGRSGGGLYSVAGRPILEDVVFLNNSSAYGGGLRANDVILRDVTFSGNSASLRGGGLHSGGTVSMTDIIFSSNTCADGGGGASFSLSDHIDLTNVTFQGNSAGGNGGGLLTNGLGTSTLRNIRFLGNTAVNSGGGMYHILAKGQVSLTNVIFSGNTAAQGGGMFNGGHATQPGSVELAQVSFSGNQAANGGSLSNTAGITTRIVNSIFWGNINSGGSPSQIMNSGALEVSIAHSDIQGAFTGGVWDAALGVDLGGNLDADPLFADADGPDDVSGTGDDNLRLRYPSPGLDAGNNAAAEGLVYDLDGQERFLDTNQVDTGSGTAPLVDLGAFETRNTPPTLTAVSELSTLEDTPTAPIAVTIGDLEVDADTLVLSVDSSNPSLVPLSAAVLGGSGANHTLTLTPAAEVSGSLVITLHVSDGVDTTSTSFPVTILAVNDPPAVSGQSVVTAEDTLYNGVLTATDIDSSNLTFALESAALHGTVHVDTSGAYTYLPDANYLGPDSFLVTVSDEHGGTSTAQVNILVVIDPTIHRIFLPVLRR